MGWGGYGEGTGGRNSQGFVMEGQVPVFQFSEAHVKVRFLTQDVKVEDLMSEKGMVREEAQDFLMTRLIHEKWIMPVARWEHQIKEILGKRFFSTIICPGRGACELCAQNAADKDNGVSENKMLSYPVRKRFFVPAYFYDMQRVLFVRGNEDFFNGIADYVNKNGQDVDFEIWKEGKGFNTKYKSFFAGTGAPMDVDWASIPVPEALDFSLDQQEWRRRIDGGAGARRAQSEQPAAQARPVAQAPAQEAAKPAQAPQVQTQKVEDDVDGFVIPFGQHKGMTFLQMYNLGDLAYVKFLAENSAGAVKTAAAAFVAKHPE